MTRVLVHAGFHKTGTTSLQSYLAQNSKALAPYFTFYTKDAFPEAARLSRLYGQRRFPWRRKAFRAAFAGFLSGIPDAASIVLSRETFAGIMPGHRDWRGRPIQNFRRAGIPLCADIVDAIRQRFGPQVDIAFLFTTRDPETWLNSVYGHLVRSIHLTEGFDGFRSQFRQPVDLDREANRIARALLKVRVHIARLEDLADRPEGPAAAVLDVIGVPEEVRRTLPRAKRHNERQSADLEAKFLELNRADLSKPSLKIQKAALLKAARK